MYYFETSALGVDNMQKPIQDALQGVVYVNDKQVTDAAPSKCEIDGEFMVRRMSQVLADAFVIGDELVYVRVEHETEAPRRGASLRSVA